MILVMESIEAIVVYFISFRMWNTDVTLTKNRKHVRLGPTHE